MKNFIFPFILILATACNEKDSKGKVAPNVETNRQITIAEPVTLTSQVTARALVSVDRIYLEETVRAGETGTQRTCQVELLQGQTIWLRREGDVMYISYMNQTVRYTLMDNATNSWVNLMINDQARQQTTTVVTISEGQIAIKKDCLFHN